MDMRSFLHNSEVNVVVLGSEFGQSMEKMFADDRARAQEIENAVWKKRPLGLRIKQGVARWFSYWL
jgi:cardiolipin synthase